MQSTGVWNRSHTETFERADFNLLTHQKHPAASMDNFLTWCRPIRHVGGKVSRVFTACELPHKKLIYRYFSYSHYHVHVGRPQCTIVAVQLHNTLLVHQGVVKLIQLLALHYRGAELGSYKIGGFTTKRFATPSTRSTIMYWAQVC